MSNDLPAQSPTMTAQIQIKRAATGKTEDWTLTFTPLADEQPEPQPEQTDVSDPQRSPA